MRNETDGKLMTLQEVAEHVGCSISTVRRWATTGVDGRVLKTVRCGRLVRTTLDDIHVFLAITPITSTPQPSAELGHIDRVWQQRHS
jgi:excisionase family DNA binding protein